MLIHLFKIHLLDVSMGKSELLDFVSILIQI